MKRKISSTLAVTLIASHMQSLSFAEGNDTLQDKQNNEVNIVNEILENMEDTRTTEETINSKEDITTENEKLVDDVEDKNDINEEMIEEESTQSEVYEAKGKLELDMNFSLPVKYTSSNSTNITVNLKKGSEIIGSVELGSDNLAGNINSEITYKLEARDSKREVLKGNAKELEFYHLTLENLSLDTYSLEIIGDGYETALIENINIENSSKRVLVGTSDNTVIVNDKEEIYPGVFLAGNINTDNLVNVEDYNVLKEKIKSDNIDKKFDLNRDSKVDITDLTYVHQNINKSKKDAIVIDTDVIVNPDRTTIDIDTQSVDIQGDIKNILKSENSSVVLQTKEIEGGIVPEISERNPVSIPINLTTARSSAQVEQIVIKAPSTNAPSSGNITIPGAGENGKDLVVSFNSEDISTKNTVDEIVIDLGKQVAVSQITINITGSRGNKNLVEIAKVEFVNNVYKEIPKPKMNVPVINNFTSATSVGNEHILLGWDHQANVTGYEVKVERLNDSGNVASTSTYKTNQNSLKIEKVKGYEIYRVSIQSLSGNEWKSGYKDEQDDYNTSASGETNLLNNLNDKDGKADNVDTDYSPQGWNSNTGILSTSEKMYGADSIVELQVIPETAPEGPEGILLNGVYKGLGVSWKAHAKAKDYDLYYRKVGEGAWTKANDPKEPYYIDSNIENNIPDGAANLKPDEKTDADELIKSTSYNINGLEDGATYEIKMTATNHLGTGGLSQTYLGATTKLVSPNIPGYKLINTAGDGELTEHIKSVEMKYTNGGKNDGEVNRIFDNDYSTAWKIRDWDGGVYYGNRMPIVTFDREYTFDTIRLATKLEETNINLLPNGAKLRIFDESGNIIQTINKNDISIKHVTDKNGAKYTELTLKEPVTAKKVELNLSVYSTGHVSISELKFYEYDSLKYDVANLFKDDLMLELKDQVTQENIDELTIRAKTMDSKSMEYHPEQEQILSDIQRAQDLLNDINLKDKIKIIDPLIINTGNTIGQSNNYQALGVAVKPGEKVNIYIGSDRKDTIFNLAITQHNAESGTAVQTYSQKLKVGKNEIVIPESAFKMDVEKGGNLYISLDRNYSSSQKIQVRVSGGQEIPHLNVNNIINDTTKEDEVKAMLRTYLRELKTYINYLPSKYPSIEDKVNNIYRYDAQTSILNTTDIEGDRFTLNLPAEQVLKGITSGLNSEEEQVNRLYETLLAWEQIMQIAYSQQGLLEKPVDFDGIADNWNEKLDILKDANGNSRSENEYYAANKVPQNRMHIKYQRMFTGAFMYASSHHVGIGYGSAADMVKGVPFKFDENGNIINSENGQLFGWGIGHEIGHVHDRPGLTYAEVTNNILPLLTQTFNDENLSRVESEGRYKEVYKRVTSQSVGIPSGNIGLILFWQLHLAYDDNYTYDMLDINSDNSLENDTFHAKLYRLTREKGTAPSENGYDQTAQTYIMRASDVVKKDLRPFFESWGLVASPKTNEYLDKVNYPVEEKAIQYLNDEARRKRLDAIKSNNMNSITMSKDTKVSAEFGTDSNGNQVTEKTYLNQKSVPLKISVNKDEDKILGYEIIRKESTSTGFKEVPVGFVEGNQDGSITEYTDVIDAVNNRTFTYKVKAYDYDLNESEEFALGTVKVSHDGSMANSNWTFDTNTMSTEDEVNEDSGHGHNEDGTINHIKDNDTSTVYNAVMGVDEKGNPLKGDPYITVNTGSSKEIIGLKYTPGKTETKKFSLKNLFTRNRETTYSPISKYEVLVSNDNKTWTKVHSGTFDTTKENTIYFNETGNSTNTQLWATNAQYVKVVAKGSTTISIAELELIGQPGDNIEIGTFNNNSYSNGIGRLKSNYEYADGKIIPAGSILITGEYRGNPAYNVPLVLNENDENFALQSQVILLAELPEDSALNEVAKGSWIYWITPEQEDLIINGESNIEGKKVKAELYRYNKLDSNNAPVGQRLVSDTFLYELPTDLKQLPLIDLTSKNLKSSVTNIVEIDKNTVIKAFENR